MSMPAINGADVNARDQYGNTPLHYAAGNGRDKIARLLIQNGADVDARNNEGNTPLHRAWSAEVATLLIQKGADIHASNQNGDTPLHRAAAKGNDKIAALLIKKGADVNASDKNGDTPLHDAAGSGKDNVAELLIEKGARVNASDGYGNTPLHYVSSAEVATLLIEKDADVKARDQYGNTPLHCAWSAEVATLLIEKDADVKASNQNGDTPLHMAALLGKDKVAALLIQKGADVNVRNNIGRTPLSELEIGEAAGGGGKTIIIRGDKPDYPNTAAIIRTAGGTNGGEDMTETLTESKTLTEYKTPTEYANALPPGSRVEGYEIVRVLGVGGFSITYLGFDDDLKIPVAIKEYLPSALVRRDNNLMLDMLTIDPRSPDGTMGFQLGLNRFLNEAHNLERLNHPNIVRLRRCFQAQDTAYIVMDYVEGETLSDLIKREGQLTEARVKEILLPLLDGLEDIHRSGLLHRDIKPTNIIIKDKETPILIDFGAACQQTGARSQPMAVIVTPGYAPLEQYSTKGNQGAWTDIYALSAVAYEALGGKRPPDSVDRAAGMGSSRDPMVPAVKVFQDLVGENFLKAIDWGLEIHLQDRPKSVAAFRKMLFAEDVQKSVQ